MVLAKGVPAQASGQIAAMGLPGIHQTASYARSYPDGSVAANIIGFTGNRNGALSGGAGLEEAENALLAGGRAASRCRSAPTGSRSRSQAATTSRW